EAQRVRQSGAFVAAELGNGLVALGSREHGKDSKGEDGGERVASAMTGTRIGNLGENLKQGKGGRHRTDLLDSELSLPHLSSPSLLAQVNLQTALERAAVMSRRHARFCRITANARQ